MVNRPCIVCGEPSPGTRCPEHTTEHARTRVRGTARQRGYDSRWDALSKRARRMQPWCSDCRSTVDLTTDHLPTAWERKAQGKSIRLRDVAVVCGDCNSTRGSSRPTGDTPRGPALGPSTGADFQTENHSHVAGGL